MQEIFDFILSHYEAILSVLTLIISVVVLILRKKPVNSVYQCIYELAISAVKAAEAEPNIKGEVKLDFALDYVISCLKDKYPNLDIARYCAYIEYIIELILSTPQKKGDK